jgi:hypothetical protein
MRIENSQIEDGTYRYIIAGDGLYAVLANLGIHHNMLAVIDSLVNQIDQLVQEQSPQVSAGHFTLTKDRQYISMDNNNQISLPVSGKAEEAKTHALEVMGNIFPGYEIKYHMYRK